jgi:hypothetical protein
MRLITAGSSWRMGMGDSYLVPASYPGRPERTNCVVGDVQKPAGALTRVQANRRSRRRGQITCQIT